MRSVLVPLDGTDFSATILDDAVRLAGPNGTLILMEVVSRPYGRGAAVYNVQVDTEEAREYLAGVAEGLRSRRISVTMVAKSTFHPSAAIDEVARANQVNMIACATHSRGAIGTVLW
jgi:nucleotide-binding universal stress UspA family protein